MTHWFPIGTDTLVDMETIYLPDAEFVIFIRSIPWSRKELKSIDGHMRWIVKDEDGTQRIVRPESAKPKDV